MTYSAGPLRTHHTLPQVHDEDANADPKCGTKRSDEEVNQRAGMLLAFRLSSIYNHNEAKISLLV